MSTRTEISAPTIAGYLRAFSSSYCIVPHCMANFQEGNARKKRLKFPALEVPPISYVILDELADTSSCGLPHYYVTNEQCLSY